MTISAVAALAGVILFPLIMVYAGLMDLVTMTIRNMLVLTLAAGWLLLAPLAGFTLAELGWSVGVAGMVLVLAFFLFAMGWIGGGDAKLAAATALWFSPEQSLLYFAYTSLIGGMLTLAILQVRTWMLPTALVRVPWIAHLHDRRTGVPYGAAMAPAALIVFPDTSWLTHAAF